MSIFLSRNASKRRLKEAENARRNRAEIVKARSQGQVTRRELFKWGIFTSGGVLACKNGLSPFARSAFAAEIPTGTPPSVAPGNFQAFTQPVPRFPLLTPIPLTHNGVGPDKLVPDFSDPRMTPEAAALAASWGPPTMKQSNTTPVDHSTQVNLAPGSSQFSRIGPTEGRPPGEFYQHQRWDVLSNKTPGSSPHGPVGFSVSLGQIDDGFTFFDLANTAAGGSTQFPGFEQGPNAVWPFGQGSFVRGVLPPPLLQARYGEPVVLRNHCNLPFDVHENGGFGRNEPATHNHNAHNGAESDGANNAHFFPGEYYDYFWSTILARHDLSVSNPKDSKGRNVRNLIKFKNGDPRASSPTNNGGTVKVNGDFREIQGTMWFHDHRFFFTSENVYKGFAALLQYFSGPDRGNERIADGINLQLPSGWRNSKTWGNQDFDVYFLVQDIATDPDNQLFFDIITTDGFLGDVMHVNYQVAGVFEVLPRRYRFRFLSAGMSRWVQLALAEANGKGVPVQVIANDGNLFPKPVTLTELSIQGTAERLDIIVDFSRGQSPASQVGKEYFLLNLLEFSNGRGPDRTVPLADAFAGKSPDPAVGKLMKFKVVSEIQSTDDPTAFNNIANSCGANDKSRVPAALLEAVPTVEPVRTRTLEFVRGGGDDSGLPFDHPPPHVPSSLDALDEGEPWNVKVNGGGAHGLDDRRVSNLPVPGDIEHWTLISPGGWGHPLHLHFEEGKTLNRNGKRDPKSIPPTELDIRKDVWRGGTLSGNPTFQVQFSEFGGAYVNHCHNTVHEDNAMLIRYDLIKANTETGIDQVHITVLPTPDPRPEGVTYVDSCFLPEGNSGNLATGAATQSCPDAGPLGPVVGPQGDPPGGLVDLTGFNIPPGSK